MISENKSSIILAISLIAIIAVFFGFTILSNPEGNVFYNQFEFVKVDDKIWQTEWQREDQLYILDFRFNPKQVEDIPVEGTIEVEFQSKTAYLTIDPSEEPTEETSYVALAAVELARKLTDPFYRDVVAACTINETDACASRPIITCDNTNQTVIHLKEADEAKITFDRNCITIQGTRDGIIKAADKLLFQWLGIMS
ncbi:hypothetical protein CMO88_00405 [Candidatus Woesearchaeota archaeon]|nr:hypothetical protein [Candidatus Woesearchaeota archaeon]|tara:strand:- start:45502 stop:46092 length:591 start_codon:yes stop_codon:yes gene_type:complete